MRFADLLASVEIVGNFLMDEKEVEQRYIQGFIHFFLQGSPLQNPPYSTAPFGCNNTFVYPSTL